jgi:hydroxyethylthiazole kinase-like uncharacterized protein yjeF
MRNLHTTGPVLIDGDSGPVPLHDSAAARRLEQAALAQHPPHTLMERAGASIAGLALALAPHARRFIVVAGPGNNGGDGSVAARHLHSAGHAVELRLLGDPGALPNDAAEALRKAHSAGVPWKPFDADAPPQAAAEDLAIDALLGLGSRRTPAGAMALAIQTLNALPCGKLAVDLPSGLHPDTGALLGSEAVRADATLALLSLKPGCWMAEGRDHSGQLWWDALGIDAADPSAWLAGPLPMQPRAHAAHKGRFGDVLVVGGARGMTGAAWLAASAALAAGAGRVYLSLLDTHAGGFAIPRPELMLRDRAWSAAPGTLSAQMVVCGCGGGDAVAAALPPLLHHAQRLVLDADGLNAVANDAGLRSQLEARGRRGDTTVLTPHPLEAARLLGCRSDEVQADRLRAAQSLAQQFGATVVLKGSGTVVTAPGELPRINGSGNAALATAGTGDVLAGWIGGMWAQRPATVRSNRVASASLSAALAADAVWLHGHSADHHRSAGHAGPLRAADLIETMAQARSLKAG